MIIYTYLLGIFPHILWPDFKQYEINDSNLQRSMTNQIESSDFEIVQAYVEQWLIEIEHSR